MILPQKSLPPGSPPIVFFDGVCGLCNTFVDFLLKRDKTGIFRVAPLQGQTASAYLNLPPTDRFESIVLLDEGGTSEKSTAVLKILSRLGGFWSLAKAFFLIPSFIRDTVYLFISRHRYEWFGKKETCRLPTPAERQRFLE